MTFRFRTLIYTTAMTLALSACQPPNQASKEPVQKPLSEREVNLRQMASSALRTGDTASAAEFYRQMAEASQGSVEGHLKAAELYRGMDKNAEAVLLLQSAELLSPGNTDVLLALGHAQTKTGNIEQAISAFDRILTTAPDNVQALSGKAVALDYQGAHEEAQALYQRILDIAPGNIPARNNMALSATLAGDYDKAIEVLEPLAHSNFSTPMIRQNLALAYGVKGETDKALALLKQDMPEEKAKQNLAFYKHYRNKRIPTPKHTARHDDKKESPTVKAAPVVAVSQDNKAEEKAKTKEVVLKEADEVKPEPKVEAQPVVAETKPEPIVEETAVAEEEAPAAPAEVETKLEAKAEDAPTGNVAGTNLNTAPIEEPPPMPSEPLFKRLKPAADTTPVTTDAPATKPAEPQPEMAEDIVVEESAKEVAPEAAKSEADIDTEIQAQIDAGLIDAPKQDAKKEADAEPKETDTSTTPETSTTDQASAEQKTEESEKPHHPFPFSGTPEYSYPTSR